MAAAPVGELVKAYAATVGAGELAETVQYEPPPGIHFDDATYTGAAYPVFGWAACLVDLAVDLDTFEVTIERCIQAIDVGKAINPVIVRRPDRGRNAAGTRLGGARERTVQGRPRRRTPA